MSTLSRPNAANINKENSVLFSKVRTTIETAFYRNNVQRITSLKEAYNLAKNTPGTIVTDLPVYRAEELDLDKDAKVLLFNDGIITGRQAKVRRLVNRENLDKYANHLKRAIFNSRNKKMYHATVYIGLHEDFMVKAHILVPEGFENSLYSWMLNFQHENPVTEEMYQRSKVFEEGDIFLYTDPDEFIPGFDTGISIFDQANNCGALLGLRYFGEFKKATLTMGWSIASRQNYTACHGGQKRFNLPNNKTYIAGVFGLSGSGKSTITHSKHDGKFDITVLHDDAFIISNENGSSISMEPSYFDKVQDYPTSSPDNKYLLTMQNAGATIDDQGRVVPVTEDIRNGNGRALKSKFWTKHRAYKFDNKIDAIFWIMKDNSMPPILKINSSVLASTLGATLATKRSSAEEGVDASKLVIEPYANPFRLYPLRNDYLKFKDLFESHSVDCYVLNTGAFLNKNITKEVTLGIIDQIVNGEIKFEQFNGIKEIEYSPIKNYIPDFNDPTYKDLVKERLETRIEFIQHLYNTDNLPVESKQSIQNVIDQLWY